MTGADAPVVDLHIEPVLVVISRAYRANGFAWRRVTLLTQQGNELQFDVRIVAFPIAFDPYPLHLPAISQRFLADIRDIVLRLACGNAGLAAGAAIEIDRHRPGVIEFFVIARLSVFPPTGYKSLHEGHADSTTIGMLFNLALWPAVPDSDPVVCTISLPSSRDVPEVLTRSAFLPVRTILTRVAPHARSPDSASISEARISIGLTPRFFAYRPNSR